MNRIRLLPEQVANQIAAGEVVERPASVVKELVENALDARAARISVEIQAGGRGLIRVTDDGAGMSRDDALLCLERHATSKIERAEDLAAISTMGFRGEALPSVASVSRFTLTTRERDAHTPEATQVVVNGGKILEVRSAGHAPGTSVEVRQLFYNLPARRKFLRSEETERAHVQHYLTLAALAYPEVGFTFTQDQRPVWQLPALKTGSDAGSRLGALAERLRALLGPDTRLLEADYAADLDEPDDTGDGDELREGGLSVGSRPKLRIWGFIGAPGVSRATRQDQHLFVNRRPVENRALNFALLEGYHTALMKGRYPVCCLFLEIDPAEVDVNIHPSKREVKFRHERAVRKHLAEAVRRVLLAFHAAPAADESKVQSPKSKVESAASRPPGIPVSPVKRPEPDVSVRSSREFPNLLTPQPGPPITTPSPPMDLPFAASGSQSTTGSGLSTTDAPPSAYRRSPSTPAAASTVAVPLLKVPLRLIGVIGKLYVVLESDRGLVLMDQHAAHERILYEQMLRRLEQGNAPSQRLLLPQTVELPPRDSQFLREHLALLGRLGVGLSEFGERTFLLDALPPFAKAPDARRFVLELVDELIAAGREVNSMRLGEHTVAKTVCRHAVKANDALSGPELENLVNDLRNCAMPYTCPHGRPTLIEMNFRELEKKFGRTQ
ncbi:MAG TPA: DNA mismatch repair endonuclease MutL [Verrucomicrobiae bacterium]|nr:DNA mismatch repair endonuclease MutL [Verrucomicrobiae bacterium]